MTSMRAHNMLSGSLLRVFLKGCSLHAGATGVGLSGLPGTPGTEGTGGEAVSLPLSYPSAVHWVLRSMSAVTSLALSAKPATQAPAVLSPSHAEQCEQQHLEEGPVLQVLRLLLRNLPGSGRLRR